MMEFQWITTQLEYEPPIVDPIQKEIDEALQFLGKTRQELQDSRCGWRRLLVNFRRFKKAYKENTGLEYGEI